MARTYSFNSVGPDAAGGFAAQGARNAISGRGEHADHPEPSARGQQADGMFPSNRESDS